MISTNRLLSFPDKTFLLFSFRNSKKWRGWLAGLLVVSVFSESCLADFRLCENAQERARATLQRIEQDWPLRGNGDEVAQYVHNLGVRLAQYNNSGRMMHWRFSVVRNLAPNAFSIGGGYVFVTDGAVNFAKSEAELAAILAHELGHELAGHFCKPSASVESEGLFDIFSAPQVQEQHIGIGALTLVIDPIKEQQADRIALSILSAAGYDPHAMLNLTRRLPKVSASHLVNSERLHYLERAVADLPPALERRSENFEHIKRILDAE